MEFQDKCPNCGHPRPEGAAFCSNCGKPFEQPERDESHPAPPPPPPPPPPPHETAQEEQPEEPKYVAWEDRENKGFFGGLWETWKNSVFNPEEFFARLPYRGGIGNPLLYALIIVWVGLLVEQLWGMVFTGFMYDAMTNLIPQDEIFWTTGLQTGFSFLYLVLAPVIIVIFLFIISGFFHLIMMIFGWAKRDFEATFRAFAYASSPMIFKIIPVCGGIVGWIWSIILAIIGLKHLQKTTGGKAALTIFLPIIVCCCILIFLFVIFGVAILNFVKEVMNSGYNYY